MNVKGRLSEVGQELQGHRAHVGVFLPVCLEGTVVVAAEEDRQVTQHLPEQLKQQVET